MPPRHDPTPPAPEPEEETPFQPAEPWWRKPLSPAHEEPSNRERSPGRDAERPATRFEASTPRVVEKRRPIQWPTIRISGRAVAFVSVCIAICAGLVVALTNDNFAITRDLTTVRGLQRVKEEDVRRASQLEGMNIFMVQPGQVAKAVQQVPGVAEANVHVWLPAQIVIDIREYAPLVAWHAVTTTVWLAETGAVVPTTNGAPPPLKLVDPSGAAADANGQLDPHVLANLKTLQAAGLGITDLFYGASEGIYFRSPEGWTVYLGNEGQMRAKLAALQELKDKNIARGARATTVDLRVDGRVQLK